MLFNQKGQALIITAVFMLLILASSGMLISWSRESSHISHYLDEKIITREIAKAGIEKSLFCLNGGEDVAENCNGVFGNNYVGENNISFENGVFTTTIIDIDSKNKQIESTGYFPNIEKQKAKTKIISQIEINTDEVNFNFGVQIGEGGLEMENNTTIVGNVYSSDGDIVGSSDSVITGDVWASGTSTIISDLVIDGDARADIIEDCEIGKDAYYNTISESTIGGLSHTPYANPESQNFPITNEQIEKWKLEAEDGGIISGDFRQDGGETVELGPKKIIGNLILENNSTLVLTGGLYVTGYIQILSGASIRLDSSYNDRSGFIIADGTIYMKNNGVIAGASLDSFVMLLSLANGGGNFDSAIELKNNAIGAVFFAPNGLIYLHNGVSVTELAGEKIYLNNGAMLEYSIGIANTEFSSGPGGSWTVKKGTWQEIK